MTLPLSNERLLLGVSGGIAAYKAADLVRRLREAGAEVRVVMTEGACQFVSPLTFQALSGQPVRTSLWDQAAEAAMGHIELARWATRVLVAPASADVIGRLAHGLAGDLLGTLCLATGAPLAVAPAMNRQMWAHPALQANLALLRSRGALVLGPASGEQACGEVGEGRMLEPQALVAQLAALGALAREDAGRLAGRRVLITAGPTFEDLDPVRFLGNRSSGKMGFAVAAAAAAMGAEVTLVAGPVSQPTPAGVRRVDVRRAAEMHAAVFEALPGQDIFIAAAAVADYAPVVTETDKIKKSAGTLSLELVRTRDILAEVAASRPRPFVVGFAAETTDMEGYARGKLERKGLDMIAGNRVGLPGSGFEADENAFTVLWPGGREELASAPKAELARQLLRLVCTRMAAGAAA